MRPGPARGSGHPESSAARWWPSICLLGLSEPPVSADHAGQELAQPCIWNAPGGMTEVDMPGPFMGHLPITLWVVVFIDDQGHDELTPSNTSAAVDGSLPLLIEEL